MLNTKIHFAISSMNMSDELPHSYVFMCVLIEFMQMNLFSSFSFVLKSSIEKKKFRRRLGRGSRSLIYNRTVKQKSHSPHAPLSSSCQMKSQIVLKKKTIERKKLFSCLANSFSALFHEYSTSSSQLVLERERAAHHC